MKKTAKEKLDEINEMIENLKGKIPADGGQAKNLQQLKRTLEKKIRAEWKAFKNSSKTS